MTLRLVLGGIGLVVAGLALVSAQPAEAACRAFATTADGFSKETAVSRSQSGLDLAIKEWAASNKIRNVRVSGLKAKPAPYWRETVTADLYLKPDVRTSRAYTVCWRGVISPAVCTSGARVCY